MGRTGGREAPAARRWADDIRCFRACMMIDSLRAPGRLRRGFAAFCKGKRTRRFTESSYMAVTEELRQRISSRKPKRGLESSSNPHVDDGLFS